MDTIRMTTAQALVRFLTQQYVERDDQEGRFFAGILGIFGHGNVTGLGQALEEVGFDLRYYQPRNEQAMVHTAAAYAKMKNRLQTFACTSSVGPGATNMLTGAAGATINRLPVLLLPGDIFANRIPNPVLQQLENPHSQDISVNDAFRPVSKYWDRINRPEQILSSLPAAMRVLTDQAETGAVTIGLPEDVQAEAYDFPRHFFAKRVYRISRPLPAQSELDYALGLIRRAKHPLIVAGGGVIYAEATGALRELANTCGIPVSETQAGKGVLPWNDPWMVGPVGATGGLAANRLAAQADLVIAIGTRLSDFTTASHSAFQNPELAVIGINIGAMDASKIGAFPLVGDARATLCALTHALAEAQYHTDAAYEQMVRRLTEEWNAAVDVQFQTPGTTMLTQANVIGVVNECSRPQDVVLHAAGGLPGDLHKLWRTCDPKGYHSEYGYSCMGYEIAGGLGVKMADPSREVYVMIGDGSYLMLNNELVTARQEGYKLIVVLIDNHGFQCIRSLQESNGTPAFGNELRFRDQESGRLTGPYVPIDFIQNAQSLGVKTLAADSRESLQDALRQATQEAQTTLIYVQVEVATRVPGYEGWWDVPVAEVSAKESVQAALQGYQESKKKQRYYY